jgi:hypothetical protein
MGEYRNSRCDADDQIRKLRSAEWGSTVIWRSNNSSD